MLRVTRAWMFSCYHSSEQTCKQHCSLHWTEPECDSAPTGMHKKSLEMSKKCSSPPASDSTRSDSFCDASERRGSGKAQEPEEDKLMEEEEDEVEEEVAIDLSSSSKQQQQEEGGASIRTASSPQQQSCSESDEHSWRRSDQRGGRCSVQAALWWDWLFQEAQPIETNTAKTLLVTMQS